MATYLSLMAYPGKVYKFYAHIIDIDISVVESIISGCFRLDVSTKNIVWASSKRVKKYEMGVCGSVIIFVWGLMA